MREIASRPFERSTQPHANEAVRLSPMPAAGRRRARTGTSRYHQAMLIMYQGAEDSIRSRVGSSRSPFTASRAAWKASASAANERTRRGRSLPSDQLLRFAKRPERNTNSGMWKR